MKRLAQLQGYALQWEELDEDLTVLAPIPVR